MNTTSNPADVTVALWLEGQGGPGARYRQVVGIMSLTDARGCIARSTTPTLLSIEILN